MPLLCTDATSAARLGIVPALPPGATRILREFYGIKKKKTITKFRWRCCDNGLSPNNAGRIVNFEISFRHLFRIIPLAPFGHRGLIIPRVLHVSRVYNWVRYKEKRKKEKKMIAPNGTIAGARPTVAVCFLRGNNEPSELLGRRFASRYLDSGINSP